MNGRIRFSVLASGSKGNSLYIEAAGTRLLVDAGLSAAEIERRLGKAGIEPACLNAIIITHEHSDHIKGAGPFSRRYDLPLYINHETYGIAQKVLGKPVLPNIIETGESFKINDLTIETFTKCHDAADPVGLVISLDGIKIGVATDLGRSTRLVEDRLKGCSVLILEFNHDPCMLEKGPYPLHLKQRIKGGEGHLSNDQAGELLKRICNVGLRYLVLAHLSEVNNDPQKAYQTALNVLGGLGLKTTDILIAEQDQAGPMIELT